MKYLFDLDGTLTAKETIPVIAEHFNIEEQIIPLTRQTIQGAVPFTESFMERVEILRQFSVSEISQLLSTVPLHPMLLQFIQQHHSDCIVVTGNLDCWCQALLQKIGCKAFCSEAIVRKDKVIGIRQLLDKKEVVHRYQQQGEYVVFIGDGHNDLEAMQQANLAIASGLTHKPAPSLLAFTDRVFYDENELCEQLDRIKGY